MIKLKIYAAIAARLTIILVGFIFLPLIFILYVISLIAETYISSLSLFVTNTKSTIAHFDQLLKANK